MSQPYLGTLQFYRRFIKTIMKSFDGDYEMFHRVRLECRNKILENKNESDVVKIHDQIFIGEETRDFLHTNVVQGNLQQNGRYRFKYQPQHATTDKVKP